MLTKEHEYEIFLEHVNKMTDRRPGITTTYMSVNTAIVGLLAIVLVVCWLNNARNSLPGLAEHGSVGHLPKMGAEPCEVASQRNFN